jgi:hypothetical protein
MTTPSVFELLAASGPFADDAEKLMLYGRLVGSWDVDATWFEPSGEERQRKGRWHFAWILGGRAIQDVLFAVDMPPDRFGTTLRCYDVAADVWHIFWAQPSGAEFTYLLGRELGDRIVQEGVDPESGRRLRWSFTELASDSFLWVGEVSEDEGATWFTDQEMRATRRKET